MSDTARLLDALRRRAEASLRAVIPDRERVALIDFPNYANVGDSAIWVGQLAALRAVGVRRLRYTCDLRTYDERHLRRRIGGGTILLSGGGSFGDLWEPYQQFRERIVAAFPRNPVVLLPQSIHFRHRASLDRARRVFDAAPNLTLLLRDRRSLEIAGNEFRARIHLCPDMAFALGPLRRPRPPGSATVWLCRGDKESLAGVTAETAPGPYVDWAVEEEAAPLAAAVRGLTRWLARHERLVPAFRVPLSMAYPRVAARRLDRGCRIVSAARCVVTDRLHGHILCLLMGVPHVVMDNSYGKVRACYDTWTSASTLAHWASSIAEADATAARLVAA